MIHIPYDTTPCKELIIIEDYSECKKINPFCKFSKDSPHHIFCVNRILGTALYKHFENLKISKYTCIRVHCG